MQVADMPKIKYNNISYTNRPRVQGMMSNHVGVSRGPEKFWGARSVPLGCTYS